MRKFICLFFCIVFFSGAATAEWSSVEIKDEMRGISSAVHTLTAEPINGSGPSVSLRVVDSRDGRPGVIFEVAEGSLKGCPSSGSSICDISLKFDDGGVKQNLFTSSDGVSFIPISLVAFAGSLTLSSALYIEIDLLGKGKRQYRFDTTGLDVIVDRGPELSFLGYSLGEHYDEVKPPLKLSAQREEHVCYRAQDVPEVLGKEKANEVTLCFHKGVFYMALIKPGSKLSYLAGLSVMDKAFGSRRKDAVYPSWPDDEGKLLSRNTREAAYLALGGKTYDDPFIITDRVISPLTAN